jgi:hypothetical protein
MSSLIATIALAGIALVDKTPNANDVKAGWGAFAVFIGMALAVAVLGVSLTRHLRKTDRNAESGVFDDPAADKARPSHDPQRP